MPPTLLEFCRENPDRFRSFLFDIDGTLLLGNTPIPGAPEFLDHLRKQELSFFFLTNNSTQNHQEIAARLTSAGIPAMPDEIISSSDPVPKYFRRVNRTGKAWRYFLIGRSMEIPGVIEYEKDPAKIMECDGVLHNGGKYDWLVVLTAILNFFLRYPEKPFLVANPDILNPVKDGVTVASNGQMELVIALLEKRGIKKERILFGKPFAPIYKEVLERVGSIAERPDQIVGVGDWLNSDIMGANRAGMSSCLVLTGLSTEADIPKMDEIYHPDIVVSRLS